MLVDTVKKSHPLAQLLIFGLVAVASILACLLVAFLIGLSIFGQETFMQALGSLAFENDSIVAIHKIMQASYTVGLFLLPPILFAFLNGAKPKTYLNLDQSPDLRSVVYAMILIVSAIPLNNFLYSINQQFPFPNDLARFIHDMEKNAEVATEAFLKGSGLGDYFINLTLIAVLPAIGEELFFRGILQKHFERWTKNIHVAIIITSILFSALHMQFYGFLPRFILGVVMGYLYAWSGNLWVAIAAHFANNGFTVTVLFFSSEAWKLKMEEAGKINEGGTTYAVFSAMLLSVLLFGIYQNEQKRKEKIAGGQSS